MVELNCETDFVAKSADFQALADKILRVAVDEQPADLAALKAVRSTAAPSRRPCWPSRRGSARSWSSSATSTSTARWRSTCTAARPTCRPPSARSWRTTAADDELAKGVAMHIAAARPAVPHPRRHTGRRAGERAAHRRGHGPRGGQARAGAAKIVEGRINGFYKDVVLLEQPSVQEPKKTVKAVAGRRGRHREGLRPLRGRPGLTG